MAPISFTTRLLVFCLTLAGLTGIGNATHAQGFSFTSCLAAGGFCDASNTCVRYAPVRGGEVLQEFVLGGCNLPGTIIIGPDNTSGPRPNAPHVAFLNDNAGDFVIPGKDQQRGLPGGMKTMQVMVVPQDKKAVLTLTRTSGKAGSAVFQLKNRTDTKVEIEDGDTITINAGAVSDRARNMKISATIDGKPVMGTFEFTIFRVDAAGFINGTLNTVLPKNVLANSGDPVELTDGNQVLLTMRGLYQDLVTERRSGVTEGPDGKRDERGRSGVPDLDRVGHKHIDEVIAYGGIVLKGTIVPSGIPHTDFSRDLRRTRNPENRLGFNWRRTKTVREAITRKGGNVDPKLCANDFDDDDTDTDEDLIADDGAVWAFDTPTVVVEKGKGRPDTQDGDVVRGAYTFKDWVEYGGVRVSKNVDWHWLYSHKDPDGAMEFVQDNTFGARDNKMGLTTIAIDRTKCVVPAR